MINFMKYLADFLPPPEVPGGLPYRIFLPGRPFYSPTYQGPISPEKNFSSARLNPPGGGGREVAGRRMWKSENKKTRSLGIYACGLGSRPARSTME